MNKERLMFSKNKIGYLVPIIAYIRFVPSFIHGS